MCVRSFLVKAILNSSSAIINIVDFYLDQPNVVSQLRAADAKNPDLEGYIYEAMRKHHSSTLFWC
jgi:hypothetical protein